MIEQTLFFEDYELGSRRMTTGRTVTRRFRRPCRPYRRFFPHHMDSEFCKDASRRTTDCPWHHDLFDRIGMTASLINPVAFSYGNDRLRFVRPVHIGDTIRTR